MPTHEINMTIPPKVVLNKDTEFDVHSDGAMLGSLKVSRGTIEWRPANFNRGYHLEWETFDQLMRKEGWQITT